MKLIEFLERALMKAENFKTENLEKLSDEGKDENIDIVKKKFQEAGLYLGNAWSKITGPVEPGVQLEECVLSRIIMRITFCLEGLYIIVHPQIYRASAGTEVHSINEKFHEG